MNSKIISTSLFLALLFLLGCGVKSAPLNYPEVSVPSYLNSYTDQEVIVTPSTPAVPKK